MKKVIAGIVVLAGLAAGGVLADRAVERDLEYRRLIDRGDEALGRGQTIVAIEAYSDAIALNDGSMLAYLKRGEAHQRRGGAPEALTAALRDLRTAANLQPGATRTLEKLGDVNVQLRRYANAAENYERTSVSTITPRLFSTRLRSRHAATAGSPAQYRRYSRR